MFRQYFFRNKNEYIPYLDQRQNRGAKVMCWVSNDRLSDDFVSSFITVMVPRFSVFLLPEELHNVPAGIRGYGSKTIK